MLTIHNLEVFCSNYRYNCESEKNTPWHCIQMAALICLSFSVDVLPDCNVEPPGGIDVSIRMECGGPGYNSK